MNNLQYSSGERNHYFYGKLMTVRDFQDEQTYMNNKRRLGNRLLHGAGIVAGLGVLLAIVVGGELFGIPGMVAGVPTLAVLAALARQAVGAGLTARGLPEEPPPAPQKKTVTKKEKN